ncbi:MAG: hypothetical protein QXK37_06570 [Candidatus Woesearchaeota archaeon]
MAKEKKSDKDLAKWKRKKWFPIVAPSMFGNMVVGETLVLTPEQMIGKPLVSNLMGLTNDMKKQNINVKFVVTSIKDQTGLAELVKYEISPSSIRRLVRRKHSRIDCSNVYETKDNRKVKIKTLFITKVKVKRSIGTALRKQSQKLLTEHLKGLQYEDFCKELISGKLNDEMKRNLSKTYPLRICDIRVMELQKKTENANSDN